MGRMPTLELPVPPAVELAQEAAPAAVGRTVAALGTWMAILGAIRLAGGILTYASVYREVQATGLIAMRGWGWFLVEHPPISPVVYAWPMVLGIWLRRTRWRELVWAGALTFLVLSIGGLLTTVADWNPAAGRTFTIGSFQVPKANWHRLSTASMAMGLAGVTQLLLELMTGAYTLSLAARSDGEASLADRDVARRSQFSRLAIYVSITMLVLTIRLPAWSACVELLSQSQWIREFILRDDLARLRASRKPALHESSTWVSRAREMLDEGEEAWYEGKYDESAATYHRLAAMLDPIPNSSMDAGERRLAARSLNNWAWLLATCPRTTLRNPEDAVKYARKALDLEPNDGSNWNTLGVAYFRLESWDDALSALYRSMDLRDEGDSSDWFFLAMIHERLGHKERAREWYDKAVQWTRTVAADNEELYRFEVEAAETLGLPRPDRPLPPPGRRPRLRRSFGPYTLPGHRGRMGSRLEDSGRSMETATPTGPALRRRRRPL